MYFCGVGSVWKDFFGHDFISVVDEFVVKGYFYISRRHAWFVAAGGRELRVWSTLEGPDIAISTFICRIFLVSKGTHPDVHTTTP